MKTEAKVASPTHQKIVKAVLRAVSEHDVPNSFGLYELEALYGGPACGAAGGVVAKWPDAGIVLEKPAGVGALATGVLRVVRVRQGRQTRLRVEEEIPDPAPRKMVLWDDYTGLPRVYAVGPADQLEETRALARRHLAAYCAKNEGIEPDLADPSRFTERIEEVAP